MKPILPTFSDPSVATPAGVALPKIQPSFTELIALAAKGGKQAVAEALDVSPDEVVRILAQDSVSVVPTASSVIPSERQRVEEAQDSSEVHMDTENYGKPPEEFGIAVVTEIRKFSETEPECAESTEDPGVWFYNRPAFDRLVKMWVLNLPSEEQLLMHINAIPGNAVAKARVMNPEGESFPGFRDAVDGKVWYRGDSAYWWVFSPDGSARCVYLDRGDQDAVSLSYSPRNGFLVPVLSDKK